MGYINNDTTEKTLYSASLSGSIYSFFNLGNYSYSYYAIRIGNFVTGFNKITKKFYCGYITNPIPTPQYAVYVESDTYNFDIQVKKSTNLQEIITPSIDDNFRTNLEANMADCDLNFDVLSDTVAVVYINGMSATVNGINGVYNPLIIVTRSGDQIIDALNPIPVTTWARVINNGDIGIGEIDRTHTYSYRATSHYGMAIQKDVSMTLNEIYVVGNTNYTVDGHQADSTYVSGLSSSCRFKYVIGIDHGVVPDNVLHFSGGGKAFINGQWDTSGEWFGTTSPEYVYFGIANLSTTTVVPQSVNTVVDYSPTENATYNNNAVIWTYNDPLPETIGPISLLNPWLINPATNNLEGSTTKNTRIMMFPELETADKYIQFTIKTKEIVDTDEWEPVNCSIVADDAKVNITNVLPDSKLFVDNICHDHYSDESGLVPPEYRQKHMTKQRFLHLESYEVTINELGEEVLKRVPLKLKIKYKAYGDNTEKIFEYKPFIMKKWIDTETGDDLPGTEEIIGYFYDLCRYRQPYRADFQDGYMMTNHPEKFAILGGSGTTGDLYNAYRDESCCNSMYYGPNMFGYIELSGFEEGKNYRIKKLYSMANPNYSLLRNDSKDEFKEPDWVGIRQPQAEEEDQHQFYMNRYMLFNVGGKASFEMPCMTKTVLPGENATPIFNFLNVRSLNCPAGEKILYPRDDFDELYFGVREYEPDENGNYPLQALYSGYDTLVFWIASDYDYRQTTGVGITMELPVKPRFDTLSGNYLYRYLQRKPVIECHGVFGAKIAGICNPIDEISYIDTSAFPNYGLEPGYIDTENKYGDYFGSNAKGTQTTVIAAIRTVFENVVDGMKYNFSYVMPSTGKILRNLIGKILHNQPGKILKGSNGEAWK